MRFAELLKNYTPDSKTPSIAFLGDSVTQGVFETYEKNGKMEVVIDGISAYPTKMKEMLKKLYPETPVDFINSGLNGSNATKGYERLMQDVIPQKPDLLIVCFGLNDSNAEMDGLETYKTALKKIFHAAKEADIETIFMTPNMFNTHSGKVEPGEILPPLADIFAKRQLEGVFDAYMNAARQLCREENVTLCDCYAIWKIMFESGIDITSLLSNGLNHPIRKMHLLFAQQLVQTIHNS
jgi:lysophospholipase L1-like esterase